MQAYLLANKNLEGFTPDPRQTSSQPISPATEYYRLNVGSQALGYLNLYKVTGKKDYLREAEDRLNYLLTKGNEIWTNSSFDGYLGYAFLLASEFDCNETFKQTGLAVAQRCLEYDGRPAHGELNWGMMCAWNLAQAYKTTKNQDFLDEARGMVTRTQYWQNDDGSFPHHSDFKDNKRNLAYSSFIAFEFAIYKELDTGIDKLNDFTVNYKNQTVKLDFNKMYSSLVALLKKQLNGNGSISYVSPDLTETITTKDPVCEYCKNPYYIQCQNHCTQFCGENSNFPCGCVDSLEQCLIETENGVGSDPVCIYCSNNLYPSCQNYCSQTCGSNPSNPCGCLKNCTTTVTTNVTYYAESNPDYDTRGWTSELASTAVAMDDNEYINSKWGVLNFLLGLQNEDGSFPDKWDYFPDQFNAYWYFWSDPNSSVLRTSVNFFELSQILKKPSLIITPFNLNTNISLPPKPTIPPTPIDSSPVSE
jgi:hypothetical protein